MLACYLSAALALRNRNLVFYEFLHRPWCEFRESLLILLLLLVHTFLQIL